MITHYGLFWSSADVLWSGVKGTPGLLQGREKTRLERPGRPSKSESEKAKDFSAFVGVYCLYRGAQLVYVGEAGLDNKSNFFKRLSQHLSDHLADRWDTFSWFGRPAGDLNEATGEAKAALAQLEAVLIAVTNPGFNKQNGAFHGAVQVFQVPHDRADGDLETKFERLMGKLEAIEKIVTPPREKKKRGRKRKVTAAPAP